MPTFFNDKDQQYYLDMEHYQSASGNHAKIIVVNSKREKVCDFISVLSNIMVIRPLTPEISKSLQMSGELDIYYNDRKMIDPKTVRQLELAKPPAHTDEDAPMKEAA